MLKINKQIFSKGVINKDSMLTATISIIHDVVKAIVNDKEYDLTDESLLPYDKDLYSTVHNNKQPLHTVKKNGISSPKTDVQLKLILKNWLPVKDGLKVKGALKDGKFDIIKYKL